MPIFLVLSPYLYSETQGLKSFEVRFTFHECFVTGFIGNIGFIPYVLCVGYGCSTLLVSDVESHGYILTFLGRILTHTSAYISYDIFV